MASSFSAILRAFSASSAAIRAFSFSFSSRRRFSSSSIAFARSSSSDIGVSFKLVSSLLSTEAMPSFSSTDRFLESSVVSEDFSCSSAAIRADSSLAAFLRRDSCSFTLAASSSAARRAFSSSLSFAASASF